MDRIVVCAAHFIISISLVLAYLLLTSFDKSRKESREELHRREAWILRTVVLLCALNAGLYGFEWLHAARAVFA
jgi:hypothetical protein